MVRFVTYMVAIAAMILGIKALDNEAEIQMQDSLMDANIIAAAEIPFVEYSKMFEEDARKTHAAPKPARGKSRGSRNAPPSHGKKNPAPKDKEDDDNEEGGGDEEGEDENAFFGVNEVWEMGADGKWVQVGLY